MTPEQAAERIIGQFVDGWSKPTPTAFDDFLADDVVLMQPGIPTVRGRHESHEYLSRLLLSAHSLTGTVLSWSSSGNVMFIEVQFSARRSEQPGIAWNALDRVSFDN